MPTIFYIPVSILYLLVSCTEGHVDNETLTQCTHLVTPNGTCQDSISVPCHTLGYYMTAQFNQSNTTFCFLPGIHVLNNGSVTMDSLSNIAFVGLGAFAQSSVQEKANEFKFISHITNDDLIPFAEPMAIIQCDTFSGFQFTNIKSLLLINLTIANCGANVSELLSQKTSPINSISLVQYVSVLMINISNLHIETTSIQNSTGYGLMGINILGSSVITGSSFVGNNQIVKSSLLLYNATPTYCNDGSNSTAPAFYVNNATKESSVLMGGNALFIYDELLNHSMNPVLNISSCLFALGIDGSIGLENNNLYEINTIMGTGLSAWMTQNVSIFIANTVTYRNQAFYGANLYLQMNPPSTGVMVSGVNSSRGISYIGGGLLIINNPLSYPYPSQNQVILTHSSFSTDYNPDSGLYILDTNEISPSLVVTIEHCTLSSNLVVGSTVQNIMVIINYSYFDTPGCSGGIGAFDATLQLSNCTFNRTNLYASESDVIIADGMFANSLFSANELHFSHLLLTGNIIYINNKASQNGGALYLFNTDVTISAPANITFLKNAANLKGGAIYIYTKDKSRNCIISFNDPNGTLDSPGIHLHFEGNNADLSGNVLYGGDIDICNYNCTLTPNYGSCPFYGYMAMIAIPKLVTYFNNGNATAMVSSDPRGICSCTNVSVSCNSAPGPIRRAYPGQTVDIPFIVVGQLLGASPDHVLSSTCDFDNHHTCTIPSLDDDNKQKGHRYCTNYSYLVVENVEQVKLTEVFLIPESAYIESYPYYSFHTPIQVHPCPFGFVQNNSSHICTCTSLLQKYKVKCDIDNLKVSRTAGFWIGNNSEEVLSIHIHCPYDYCVTTDISFNICDDQDTQCNYNRSGVLCGGWRPNFSTVFGSTKCKNCTNQSHWVIIPIAVTGLVMLALIFIFNFTVTVGTLNGLILYANIIKSGIINLLPTMSHQRVSPSFFIDWLNLDLGIETCFYDGMDTYDKTWLGLLFPLYILALVGAIIIGSRWSSKLAWLSKSNAVPVLATLILLSYTAFFNSVVTVFSYTQLDTDSTPLNSSRSPAVWLVDGNVLYMNGKHLYLVMAALIITVAFIVPYTTILLIAPWLQAKSHFKLLQWVNKLKPFIDAYQAPFKDQYRYWPGVHLMIRAVLYLIFTTNQANDINVNLLACVVVFGVYSGTASVLSVYKSSFLNIIEVIFATNIMLLSTSLLYIRTNNDMEYIVAMLSIACAFVVFVIIVAKDLIKFCRKWTCKKSTQISTQVHPVSTESSRLYTCNAAYVMEFREPMLDDI